jgi:diacylglycerol kinase
MLDPPDQAPAARRFQFTGRIRSFYHAMRGILHMVRCQHNAFELLADVASPEFQPLVRDAKDVAAGAVLLTSVAAVVIGAIVFWPHIERFFRELS